MTLAIVLVISGILIAVYPQLLSLIVSFLLIFAGLSILFIRHYFRDHFENKGPFSRFFLRY